MQARQPGRPGPRSVPRTGNGTTASTTAGSGGNGHGDGHGHDEELRRLFDRYFRSVFHFFLNRGLAREEALDLTQDTFLRVYRSLQGFRGEAKIETWLFRIATNLWNNEVRRRKAEKREGWEVSLEGVVEGGHPIRADHHFDGWSEPAGPLEAMLDDERRQLLREALGELPPQMRRCVLLRIDQNLKYREIAGVMQISIETVKSQLSQARDRLEQKLGRYFDSVDL